MIPKHKQFIEAIKEKKKISLQFYSTADSGVIDLICAPTDYGPGAGTQDGVNRYWFWDYTGNTGSPDLRAYYRNSVWIYGFWERFLTQQNLRSPRPCGRSLGIGDLHADREQKILQGDQPRPRSTPIPLRTSNLVNN
jgi:hypothetical protein